MKNKFLLVALSWLIGFSAFAQFPVSVSQQNKIDVATRIVLEGMRQNAYNGISPSGYLFNGTSTPETEGTVSSTDASYNSVSYVPLPTRLGLIQELRVWSSSPVKAIFTTPEQFTTVVGGASGTYQAFPNFIITAGDQFQINTRSVVSPVKDGSGTITNKNLSIISAQIVRASSDVNYGAKQTIYWLGDSNAEGSSISSTVLTTSLLNSNDFYTFKVRNYLNGNGNDARLIDKSIGGKSSNDFETYRNRNYLDLPESPAEIYYNHGTNNQTASTYGTDVKAFIKWALAKWPRTKIIILGSPPAQGVWPAGSGIAGTNRETLLNTIRALGQSAVNEVNLPNQVTFINLGLSFSVSDDTQYSDTEVSGSKIHLGVKGHQTVADYIWTNLPSAFKQLFIPLLLVPAVRRRKRTNRTAIRSSKNFTTNSKQKV